MMTTNKPTLIRSNAWNQGYVDATKGRWDESMADRDDTADDYQDGWTEGQKAAKAKRNSSQVS